MRYRHAFNELTGRGRGPDRFDHVPAPLDRRRHMLLPHAWT